MGNHERGHLDGRCRPIIKYFNYIDTRETCRRGRQSTKGSPVKIVKRV